MLGLSLDIWRGIYGVGATYAPGAKGAWYADQYSATPRQHIPNEITKSSVSVSANVLSLPRRTFATDIEGAQKYGGDNVTFTDIAAAGPDGVPDASRMVGTGNWRGGPKQINAPIGTYTVACQIKSNTGASQTVKIGDFYSTFSGDIPVTTSWQLVYWTFTTTDVGLLPTFKSFDGSTGCDVLIRDFVLYEGTVVPSAETLGGHMYLGINKYTSPVTVTGGELDVSAGGYGVIQFSLTSSPTAVTVQCCLKKLSTVTSLTSFLSKLQAFSETIYYVGGGTPYGHPNGGPRASGAGASNSPPAPGLWRLNGQYQVVTYRYDGTYFDAFYDDVLVCRTPVAPGAIPAVADFFVGITADTSFPSDSTINSMRYYERALTDDEVTANVGLLRARAIANGLTVNTGTMLITLGDSITYGYGLPQGAYPELYALNTTQPQLFGANLAENSSKLFNVQALAPRVMAMLNASSRIGKKNIVHIGIGSNDLAVGDDLATFTAGVLQLARDFKTAGAKVTASSIISRTAAFSAPQQAAFDAARATYRTSLFAAVGTDIDAVIDAGNDANLGPSLAANNATVFQDFVHPTAVGQGYYEAVARPVWNAL